VSQKPRYHDSWMGKVLKAIVIDGAETWSELQATTEIPEKGLNQTLSELFRLNLLGKNENTKSYYVSNIDIEKEYQAYYQALTPEEIEAASSLKRFRDESHAKLVEYIIRKELFGSNANIETEYRSSYFKHGRYIDVVKWNFWRNKNYVGIFEIKPYLDDIGSIIRQIKNYCFLLNHKNEPIFSKLPNKRIMSYLVILRDKKNYEIFYDFRFTFMNSGVDFIIFVDPDSEEDFIVTAKAKRFDYLDNLHKWIYSD
jgi:hypothetical protein